MFSLTGFLVVNNLTSLCKINLNDHHWCHYFSKDMIFEITIFAGDNKVHTFPRGQRWHWCIWHYYWLQLLDFARRLSQKIKASCALSHLRTRWLEQYLPHFMTFKPLQELTNPQMRSSCECNEIWNICSGKISVQNFYSGEFAI